MKEKGISQNKILNELKIIDEQNIKYDSGRILGSMCTSPHPFAKKVFNDFFDSNLGDSGLFKGTKLIENRVIKELGTLLSLKNPYGYILTGGTESNLMAMRAARNFSLKEKEIKSPEIIVSKSAHFSFKKASDMLGLKIVEADLDENYKIDVDTLDDKFTKNTVAVVAVAGTTELGLIDPIEDVSKIAIENDSILHVDAAFGGFTIPFLKKSGMNLPNFDFSIKGVSSMTIDPHKMGLAPIPAGCILFSDEKYLESMLVESPYLTVKQQATIVGTRSGASAVATWALMEHLGYEGYIKIAKEAIENSLFLANKLKENGFELVAEIELNIVAFNHPKIDANILYEELIKKGWVASTTVCPKAIRIVIMPHIRKTHLELFLIDLKEIVKNLI